MNFRNLYRKRRQIISGHYNEVIDFFKLTADDKKIIFFFRENICNLCPVKSNNFCDKDKWIHPESRKIRYSFKKNYIRGCGCRLTAKQKANNAKCPAGFWGGEEIVVREENIFYGS